MAAGSAGEPAADDAGAAEGGPETGGDAAEAVGTEPGQEGDAGAPEEAGTAGSDPRPVNPDDQDGDGVDDDLEERIALVLEKFGGVELKPVDTEDNGATIFGVIASDGEELERGTLLHLEELALKGEEVGEAAA